MWKMKTKQMKKHNETETVTDTENKQMVARGEETGRRGKKTIMNYSVPQEHKSHFKCSVATCSKRLPYWTAEIQKISFITEYSIR